MTQPEKSPAPGPDALKPPSEEFENAFSDHCSGCVRECACGRTLFDVENDYDWEKGELEELERQAARDPGKYVALPYSVSTCTVNGKEFVMGCPCNGMRRYEDFILDHAEQIADYLNRRAELLKRKAEAMKCNAAPPKMDGWQAMDWAPRNASMVELLLHDGGTCEGHFAQDLSGEEQPMFSGWFKEVKSPAGGCSHYQAVTPVAWKPCPCPHQPS